MIVRRKFSVEAKVGLFVLACILILGYLTIDVSQLGLASRNTYTIYAIMTSAEGVSKKTPVQMAGIPVGLVSSIELMEDRQARVGMNIKRDLKLREDTEAQIRTRGILGDTYIELVPGSPDTGFLKEGEAIRRVKRKADYQDLSTDLEKITKNMVDITDSLKVYAVSEDSRFAQILKNMEALTANMAAFSTNNMQNMNAVVVNLRALTQDLRNLSSGSSGEIEVAINRISELSDKLTRGDGTIGRLVNDPTTVEKANEVLDNVKDLTRTISSLQTEIGYHLEYLGGTGDAKNYVSLKLTPRPDKFFLFEIVHDPQPPPDTSTSTSTVTAGNQTSVIETVNQSFNKIRFSAQLGKKFGDFTIRGGLIESTGGAGVDYNKGPFGVQFSAFDFSESNRPHLKLMTTLNITPSIYILGGLDDFISNEHSLNWFVGAGIRLTDEDLKSLIGGAVGFLR